MCPNTSLTMCHPRVTLHPGDMITDQCPVNTLGTNTLVHTGLRLAKFQRLQTVLKASTSGIPETQLSNAGGQGCMKVVPALAAVTKLLPHR